MARKRGPTWHPREEDYQRVFAEQNPWHRTGEVPETWAKKIERPLAKGLHIRTRLNEPARFQLILGPRRVGKTTLMHQTVRNLLAAGIPRKKLWWLRLDHPLFMQIPLDDLAAYVVRASRAAPDAKTFLFLDELTYSDKWDLWLKTFYDDSWPVQIIGTSSSTAALRDRRIESGVGRWEEQYLAPYLFTEYLELTGNPISLPLQETLAETITACVDAGIDASHLANERRRFLLTGGFPELLVPRSVESADETSVLLQSQRTLRNDAVERAVYKDIPQAFGVDSPMLLERILYTLAGQVTGVLSPNTVCQSIGGVSQPTFTRYLSYLERAFLVFTLPNYSGSEASVQKRGRKLYFVDGAVRNAALQRGVGPLSDLQEMGLLIENLAAGHLHALAEQGQIRLYHWRDKNDEIDLVYDQPNSPLAFEIASSGLHHRKGIAAFMGRYPRFEGRCYLVAPDCEAQLPANQWDKVGTLPLDLFLVTVAAQAEYELLKRLGLLGRIPTSSEAMDHKPADSQ